MTEHVDPWQTEATEKGLPEDFVERLAASDAVTEAEKAKIVASVSTAKELEEKRNAAIAYGKLLGEDEANRRRETGDWRESRIRRAMMYAAWEFDGKPGGHGGRYREEFGVREPAVAGSLERLASPRLLEKP